MSRVLHYFLIETITFLYRRTEAIHLPSFFEGKHPGESEGKVWDGSAAEVEGIL
jgi:hypothetical protein